MESKAEPLKFPKKNHFLYLIALTTFKTVEILIETVKKRLRNVKTCLAKGLPVLEVRKVPQKSLVPMKNPPSAWTKKSLGNFFLLFWIFLWKLLKIDHANLEIVLCPSFSEKKNEKWTYPLQVVHC